MFGFSARHNRKKQERPGDALREAAKRVVPANLRKVLDGAERAMRSYLQSVTDALAKRHGQPYTGPGKHRTLRKRSGRGLESLGDFLTRKTGQDVEGVITLPRHMAQQEFGGIVAAKSGKYLAIPLPAALKRDGTPKKMRASDWKGTYVVKGKRGGKVIMLRRVGKDAPLYALKPRARIPARLGLRKELKRQRPDFRRNVVNEIRKLIAGWWRVVTRDFSLAGRPALLLH